MNFFGGFSGFEPNDRSLSERCSRTRDACWAMIAYDRYMSVTVEREVKLVFENPPQAVAAVASAGAVLSQPRRLQEDCLLDTPDRSLRERRSLLRVRAEPGQTILTFKGPVWPSTLKVREELETAVEDRQALLRILEALGLAVWFRYEKYRTEYQLQGTTVAIDETPVGTFVEVEGTDLGVAAVVTKLGRTPRDYVTESYRELFVRHCAEHGVSLTDMLFERR